MEVCANFIGAEGFINLKIEEICSCKNGLYKRYCNLLLFLY